jgi:hypothetical protein
VEVTVSSCLLAWVIARSLDGRVSSFVGLLWVLFTSKTRAAERSGARPGLLPRVNDADLPPHFRQRLVQGQGVVE